jgi:hypothetical protein
VIFEYRPSGAFPDNKYICVPCYNKNETRTKYHKNFPDLRATLAYTIYNRGVESETLTIYPDGSTQSSLKKRSADDSPAGEPAVPKRARTSPRPLSRLHNLLQLWQSPEYDETSNGTILQILQQMDVQLPQYTVEDNQGSVIPQAPKEYPSVIEVSKKVDTMEDGNIKFNVVQTWTTPFDAPGGARQYAIRQLILAPDGKVTNPFRRPV